MVTDVLTANGGLNVSSVPIGQCVGTTLSLLDVLCAPELDQRGTRDRGSFYSPQREQATLCWNTQEKLSMRRSIVYEWIERIETSRICVLLQGEHT